MLHDPHLATVIALDARDGNGLRSDVSLYWLAKILDCLVAGRAKQLANVMMLHKEIIIWLNKSWMCVQTVTKQRVK